jgi:hypothetical protein
MVESEDREPRQRGKEVEGAAAVQCGLGSRVGGSTTRLTIVLQVGARGCVPPFYVEIEGAVNEHGADGARDACSRE